MPNNNYNIILHTGKYFAVPNNLHKLLPNPYEYFIMTNLLQYANGNNDGSCYPSQDTIKGTMSIVQVKRIIKKLIEKKFINRTKTDGRNNIYTINYEILVPDSYQSTTDTSISQIPPTDDSVKNIMAWADKKSSSINPALTKELHTKLANKKTVTHKITKKGGAK